MKRIIGIGLLVVALVFGFAACGNSATPVDEIAWETAEYEGINFAVNPEWTEADVNGAHLYYFAPAAAQIESPPFLMVSSFEGGENYESMLLLMMDGLIEQYGATNITQEEIVSINGISGFKLKCNGLTDETAVQIESFGTFYGGKGIVFVTALVEGLQDGYADATAYVFDSIKLPSGGENPALISADAQPFDEIVWEPREIDGIRFEINPLWIHSESEDGTPIYFLSDVADEGTEPCFLTIHSTQTEIEGDESVLLATMEGAIESTDATNVTAEEIKTINGITGYWYVCDMTQDGTSRHVKSFGTIYNGNHIIFQAILDTEAPEKYAEVVTHFFDSLELV